MELCARSSYVPAGHCWDLSVNPDDIVEEVVWCVQLPVEEVVVRRMDCTLCPLDTVGTRRRGRGSPSNRVRGCSPSGHKPGTSRLSVEEVVVRRPTIPLLTQKTMEFRKKQYRPRMWLNPDTSDVEEVVPDSDEERNDPLLLGRLGIKPMPELTGTVLPPKDKDGKLVYEEQPRLGGGF